VLVLLLLLRLPQPLQPLLLLLPLQLPRLLLLLVLFLLLLLLLLVQLLPPLLLLLTALLLLPLSPRAFRPPTHSFPRLSVHRDAVRAQEEGGLHTRTYGESKSAHLKTDQGPAPPATVTRP
jgi:hypothetical protein